MPTTFKVLGQTSATAANSTSVVNLLKDSTMEGFTGANVSIAAANTSQGVSGSYWTAFCQSATTIQITNLFNNAISAPFGSYGFGLRTSGSVSTSQGCSLRYGYSAGDTSLAGNTAGYLDTTKAISVSANTIYYYGVTVKAYNAGYFSSGNGYWPTLFIHWFDSTGAFVSSVTVANNGGTSNGSNVLKGTSTSPSTAAYATMEIRWYYNSWNSGEYVAIDGAYFAANSTIYDSGFSSPNSNAGVTLTAPFDKRTQDGWLGSANSSFTGTSYAGALVDLYTVPALTQSVVSTVTVSNLSTSATTFRLAVLPSGQTLASKHFIVLDGQISGNSTQSLSLGLTLGAGDKIKISSDIASVSASAFGSEIA